MHHYFFSFLFISSVFASNLAVTVHDVGQGHCVFLTDNQKFSALLDCGTTDKSDRTDGDSSHIAVRRIKQELTRLKPLTNKLLIIISHADKDHLSLIPQVIDGAQEKGLEVTLVLGGTLSKYFAEHYMVGAGYGLGGKLIKWMGLKEDEELPHSNPIKLVSMSHDFPQEAMQNVVRELTAFVNRIRRDFPNLSSGERNSKIEHYFNREYSNLFLTGRNLLRGHVKNKVLNEIGGVDFPLPEDIEIRILSANAGHSLDSQEMGSKMVINPDENSNSIVLKVSKQHHRNSTSFISPGDATGSTTDRMIFEFDRIGEIESLKADVALAGHHGSDEDNANSKLWGDIQKTKLKYLIFSAGNKEHHPRCRIVKNYYLKNPLIKREGDAHGFTCFKDKNEREIYEEIEASRIDSEESGSFNKIKHTGVRWNIFNTASNGTMKFHFNEVHTEPVMEPLESTS